MSVHIDELFSEVVVDSRGSAPTAKPPASPWSTSERLRAVLERRAELDARTAIEDDDG